MRDVGTAIEEREAREVRRGLDRIDGGDRRKGGARMAREQHGGVLGCSEDLVKKLGSEQTTSLSIGMALHFERRSRGEIRFLDLMRWCYDRASAAYRDRGR